MKISVRAYGMLQEALKDKNWIELDVEQDTTIAELLENLEIKRDSVMTVVTKGRSCSWDYVIHEDDKLELLPVISGG